MFFKKTSGFMSGMIILWNGLIANIPSGWALCNGSNGTSDLRNRMIVCANADSGGAAKSTITGSPTQSGGTIGANLSGSVGILASEIQLYGGDEIFDAGGVGNYATAGQITSFDGFADFGTVVWVNPYFVKAFIMKL